MPIAIVMHSSRASEGGGTEKGYRVGDVVCLRPTGSVVTPREYDDFVVVNLPDTDKDDKPIDWSHLVESVYKVVPDPLDENDPGLLIRKRRYYIDISKVLTAEHQTKLQAVVKPKVNLLRAAYRQLSQGVQSLEVGRKGERQALVDALVPVADDLDRLDQELEDNRLPAVSADAKSVIDRGEEATMLEVVVPR